MKPLTPPILPRKRKKLTRPGVSRLAGIALAALLVGCGINDHDSSPAGKGRSSRSSGAGTHFEWFDRGGPGEVKVHVNLGAQRLHVARDDKRIGWSYVATGREAHDTPAGTYRISEMVVDKISTLYGWIENSSGEKVDHDASPGDPVPRGCRYVAAPMPYWMRLTGDGIGMHAGYLPRPGEPASHGCIRLPEEFARKLFLAVSVGTPVTIERGQVNPWVVHPDPLPREKSRPKTINGMRVVSPDDPWIVRPGQ